MTFSVVKRDDGTINKSATVRAARIHLIERGDLDSDAPMPDRVRIVRKFIHNEGLSSIEDGTSHPYMLYAQAMKDGKWEPPAPEEPKSTMENFEIIIPKPGEIYKHYKGGLFEVICVGRMSTKRDEIHVVYKSLERGHTWIRPLGEWSEYVEFTPPTVVPQTLVWNYQTPVRMQRYALYVSESEQQGHFSCGNCGYGDTRTSASFANSRCPKCNSDMVAFTLLG